MPRRSWGQQWKRVASHLRDLLLPICELKCKRYSIVLLLRLLPLFPPMTNACLMKWHGRLQSWNTCVLCGEMQRKIFNSWGDHGNPKILSFREFRRKESFMGPCRAVPPPSSVEQGTINPSTGMCLEFYGTCCAYPSASPGRLILDLECRQQWTDKEFRNRM